LEENLGSSALAAQFNAPFSSRRINVETISGSVTGSYPLMDYLGVSTQSGSVKIDVFPQSALPSAPAPAELEVQTTSASIEVNLPVRDTVYPAYIPPARNYTTLVQSASGSIKGSFYLGSISKFGTVSGSIHITGMPVLQAEGSSGSGEVKPIFETHTVSGSIQAEVLNPIFITPVSYIEDRPERSPHSNPYLPIGDDDPYLVIPPSMDNALFKVDDPALSKKETLRNLHSNHRSQSSTIKVKYPEVWEGSIHEKTVSGSVSAEGHGVQIVYKKKGFASSELLARKGVHKDDEGCFVEMSNISGSIHFLV